MMKKGLLILAICFLVGCQSEKFDVNERAEELLTLVKEDGFKDMKIEEANDNEVIINNDKCVITATFNDKKITEITSKTANNTDNKFERYSCVFRTLARDKDLLGDNKDKYKEYMEKFREGKNFEYDKLKVTNDFINMSIEVIK